MARAGVTLLELLVLVAALGLVMSVVALTGALAAGAPAANSAAAAIGHARDSSLTSRRPVTIQIAEPSRAALVTAFPDGRVVAEPSLGIDPLSGRAADAER